MKERRQRYSWGLLPSLALLVLGCSSSEEAIKRDQLSATQFAEVYAEAICGAAEVAVSCTDVAGCSVPASSGECQSRAAALVSSCFTQTGATDRWADLQLAASNCLASVESVDSCGDVGLRFDPQCTELTEATELQVRDSCARLIDLCDSERIYFPYIFRRVQ